MFRDVIGPSIREGPEAFNRLFEAKGASPGGKAVPARQLQQSMQNIYLLLQSILC